jgi:predicted O-methyltransferase YrrM
MTPKSMTDSLRISIRATLSCDGWCTQEKATALAELVLSENPRRIVEIGVFGGRSLIPMALAANESNRPAEVIGIDPWKKDAAIEGSLDPKDKEWWSKVDLEEIYQKFRQNLRFFGVDDIVEVWRKTDTESLPMFVHESICILHVDGNHSPEVSRRYIDQWLPKVKKGGILIMDDIDWPTQADTVKLIESLCDPVRVEATWGAYRRK